MEIGILCLVMLALTASATTTTDDTRKGTETTLMGTAKDTSTTDIAVNEQNDTTIPGVEMSEVSEVTESEIISTEKTITTTVIQEGSDVTDMETNSTKQTATTTVMPESSEMKDKETNSTEKTITTTAMPNGSDITDIGTNSTNKAATTTVMPESSETKDKAITSTEKTTTEFPDKGSMDMDICDCPDLKTTLNCTCTARSGIIQSSSIYLGDDPITVHYRIDIGEPANAIIYYLKEDFNYIGAIYCEINLGGIELGQLDDANINAIDVDMPIVVTGSIPSVCNYTFRYFTYPNKVSINVLNSTEGTLSPPSDDYGLFGYQPCAQVLWILQPDVPVSDFKFNIDYIDLGAPYGSIHTNDVDSSAGDFLLIGTDKAVLSGNEQMFYGHREESSINNLMTLGGVSHVFFRSTSSSFNATGFNITYAATVAYPTTTPFPITTQNPPAPEELKTTYVASINGAPKDISLINKTIESFQVAIAEMSSEYVRMHKYTIKQEITPSNVEVYKVTTCNFFHCNPTCVAFNFSVAALSPNDTWIFTAPVLEDMLFTSELQDAIKKIGDDCTVCDDNPERNLWLYVPIPVGIVVFGVLVSMVLWYTGGKTNLEVSRRKYEQEIADRRDDNRRRSSGDVSILGFGGSIASRGSRSSRHYSMPFPMAKRNADLDGENEDEDGIDISEFKEFDPDLGRVDPTEFGISNYWSDKNKLGYYGNPGFVDDEEHEHTLYRRHESVATAAETDSEDSDGGAVSFNNSYSMTKRPSASTSLQAAVDVHSMDDSNPISMMEETGETAL